MMRNRLAGVMGGASSGVDETTTDVLIESALWDPLTIARTGRDLGIITDARYRFERGVDPAFMEEGLDLATQMVMDLCGGIPTKATITGTVPTPKLTIDFPVAETKRLTGIDVAQGRARDILVRLGFGVEGMGEDGRLNVYVPSNRPDIEGKADIVEEIMRINGVNEITPQPLPALTSVGENILTTGQSTHPRHPPHVGRAGHE